MPYPDYLDIENPKKRKSTQEIEGGRQITLEGMALGLIERLIKDYKIDGVVHLDASDSDFRNWTVTVSFRDVDKVYTEKFFEFPTNEFRTVQLLLGR